MSAHSVNPPPDRSLDSQIVLDEDEYTAALSSIIARDFFPSLAYVNSANDYSRNPHLLSQDFDASPTTNRPDAFRQTPAHTPLFSNLTETPFSSSVPHKRARYNVDLSLDDFQARYTSEDNSSFTRILDDENMQRKERWGWAWDAQRRNEAQQAKLVDARQRLLIEPPGAAAGVKEKFTIEAPAAIGLITDRSTAEREAEVTSEEMEQSSLACDQASDVDVMAPKADNRSASVDGWKFKTRNSLMFSPDADLAPYNATAKIDINPAEAKSIKHHNTQFPDEDDLSSPVPASPTRSLIDTAIAGNTSQHLKSNNFSLVPNLPSPTPSTLGPAGMQQLMTWGTLNATPRIISQTDDPAASQPSTPFHLPAITPRELISHKLSNNASKSLRAKAGLLGIRSLGKTPRRATPLIHGDKRRSMPPPTCIPRKADAAGNLTPAAKSLLDRTTIALRGTGAAKSGGSGTGREKGLDRIRWTPTPSPIVRQR